MSRCYDYLGVEVQIGPGELQCDEIVNFDELPGRLAVDPLHTFDEGVYLAGAIMSADLRRVYWLGINMLPELPEYVADLQDERDMYGDDYVQVKSLPVTDKRLPDNLVWVVFRQGRGLLDPDDADVDDLLDGSLPLDGQVQPGEHAFADIVAMIPFSLEGRAQDRNYGRTQRERMPEVEYLAILPEDDQTIERDAQVPDIWEESDYEEDEGEDVAGDEEGNRFFDEAPEAGEQIRQSRRQQLVPQPYEQVGYGPLMDFGSHRSVVMVRRVKDGIRR